MSVIEIENLTKRFGTVTALESFRVHDDVPTGGGSVTTAVPGTDD